jgi:hypothetical protein
MTMRRPHIPSFVVAIGVALSVVVVAAACGSSSPSASSTSSPGAGGAASAAAQVKSSWERFFAGTTPAATKVALLQNGSRYARDITAQAALPIGKGLQAKVTSVKMVSPTKAQVTYTILVAGQPVLKNATGEAVMQGGTWKVSVASFQTLLGLEKQSGGTSGSSSPTP